MAKGSENSAPAAANRPIRARKLTPLPTRFCSKVYPAQASIAISASRSPGATPAPTAPCPLAMINAAPASENSMPMIWLRWMTSWPDSEGKQQHHERRERHDQRHVDRRGRNTGDIDRAAADEHAEKASQRRCRASARATRRAFPATPSRQPAAGRAPRCSSERTRSRTAERSRPRRAPESCWRPGRWQSAESRAGPALRAPCWRLPWVRSCSIRCRRPCRRHDPIAPAYRQL